MNNALLNLIKIGMECRKALCKFIEENCTHLINFYETDRSKKVCILKLNVYRIFVKLKCLGSRDTVSTVNFLHKNSSSKMCWLL